MSILDVIASASDGEVPPLPNGLRRRPSVAGIFEQRSRGLMLLASARAQAKRPESGKELSGLRCLRQVFNSSQLRHGDKVVDPSVPVSEMPRSKQWDLRPCQTVAYRHVGRRYLPRGEGKVALGETHRHAELCSAVADVHLRAQTQAVAGCLQKCKDGVVKGLVVQRGYDATPWTVRFGALQSVVAPWARYFVKRDDGKWTTIELEE